MGTFAGKHHEVINLVANIEVIQLKKKTSPSKCKDFLLFVILQKANNRTEYYECYEQNIMILDI